MEPSSDLAAAGAGRLLPIPRAGNFSPATVGSGALTEPRPRSRPLSLLHELKERRLAQFATAYGAGGWIVLEVIDQLVGNEILPAVTYPLALVLFLCGLPGVVIVSWFHGAKGAQESGKLEKGLLAAVALIAVVAGVLTVQRGAGADAPPVAVLENLPATEDPRRLAVMYFEDRGDAEYLAPGLTEALIDELAGIDVLHVVSRNGSAQFRESTATSDSVGRTLQVGTLVTGTVQQSGEQVRVRVELIDASEGNQLDQVDVERPRAELFELQDDLAEQVALYLRGALGDEVQRIERQVGTDDVDAWELLQRAEALEEEANDLAALGDLEGASGRFASADSVLAEAEERSPRWLTPITQRGWLAYRQARLYGFDRDLNAQWVESGMEHASRALGRDSTDANARELRGTLQYWRYLINLTDTPGEARQLFENAERDFNTSVANNPRPASALSSLSHLLMNKGSNGQAMVTARRSYETDPYLQNADVTLFRVFSAALELPDEQEARTWCLEGRRRFADEYRFRECQVWLYALPRGDAAPLPDIDHAWQLCDEIDQLSPTESREFYRKRCEVVVGMALVRANLADSARAVLERARADSEIDPIRELASFEAIARTWLGDFDEAFELLATFIAANPGQAESYGDDEGWWLADLRTDPRYATLVGSN